MRFRSPSPPSFLEIGKWPRGGTPGMKVQLKMERFLFRFTTGVADDLRFFHSGSDLPPVSLVAQPIPLDALRCFVMLINCLPHSI
jgi:hypothetical protein